MMGEYRGGVRRRPDLDAFEKCGISTGYFLEIYEVLGNGWLQYWMRSLNASASLSRKPRINAFFHAGFAEDTFA